MADGQKSRGPINNNFNKMKTLSKISLILLGALSLTLAGCGGKDPVTPIQNLSDLQIYFGAESYNATAGETVSIPFTIAGVEGKTLTLTASADVDGCSFTINNDASYQGTIKATMPTVLSTAAKVNVTLKAEDKANNRQTSLAIGIDVAASEALAVQFVGDMTSIPANGPVSTTMAFKITGADADAVTITTPTATASSGWTASVKMTDKTNGEVALNSAAKPSGNVTVSINISDNFQRKASDERTMSIINITTAAGAANSFIVAPGATHTINAVQGNSTTKVDFDYARLVWQDAQGLVKAVGGNTSAGVVVVDLNAGVSGNCVVAAVKGETIVWSWHLWVTNYKPNEQPIVYTNTSNAVTYTMMDRHLGAMSATAGDSKCFGLYYQWGRKDPFVSSDGMISDVPIKIYDINNKILPERTIDLDYSKQENNAVNVDLAIANPDAFIYYSNTPDGATFKDWYTFSQSVQNNDLWGYTTKYKTIYDPCPEGWRIAPKEAYGFRNLYSKEGSLTTGGAYDSTKPWYWDDTTDCGFYYKDPSNGVKYFFPMSGKRDGSSGAISGVGGTADIWNPDPSSKYAMCQMIAFGNPASMTGLNRNYGFSIRCVHDYNF